MSLCSMPSLCVQKVPVPAGGNPSQDTSTTAAINRLRDKKKGSFLKMEDTTGPVCRSGTLKGRQGFRKLLKLLV